MSFLHFVVVSVARLFGSSTPSANTPTADVEPIIRPDLLPSVIANPSKLEVLDTRLFSVLGFIYRFESKSTNICRRRQSFQSAVY